jgi:hypothetical protein
LQRRLLSSGEWAVVRFRTTDFANRLYAKIARLESFGDAL